MDKNLHVCGFKYLWCSITNWNSLINREPFKSEKFRRFRLENVQALTRYCCNRINILDLREKDGGVEVEVGGQYLKAVFCRSPRDAAAPLSQRRNAELPSAEYFTGKVGEQPKVRDAE